MSEAEWAITEPTLPEPAWKQGRGGRPAQRCRRDTIDAIRYLVREGIRWRAMPAPGTHTRRRRAGIPVISQTAST